MYIVGVYSVLRDQTYICTLCNTYTHTHTHTAYSQSIHPFSAMYKHTWLVPVCVYMSSHAGERLSEHTKPLRTGNSVCLGMSRSLCERCSLSGFCLPQAKHYTPHHIHPTSVDVMVPLKPARWPLHYMAWCGLVQC